MTRTLTAGGVYVKLVPTHDRDLSQDDVMVVARGELNRIFGVRLSVIDAGGPGGSMKPLMVNVRGPEVDVVEASAAHIAGP